MNVEIMLAWGTNTISTFKLTLIVNYELFMMYLASPLILSLVGLYFTFTLAFSMAAICKE